ncbi:PAAR domain-containing protein [Pseudomonas paraeruginosa]|uniref:PAAR domain-containing protein n=1 Tax=Pseudomonas paraeruginosa TaxID=2994495 RepID=UPI0039FC0ADF
MGIIRLGDATSHGGTVIEAFGQTDLSGKPMAGGGQQMVCPLYKGTFPIAEGSAMLDVDGVPVALHGVKTTCGASLIANAPLGAAGS